MKNIIALVTSLLNKFFVAQMTVEILYKWHTKKLVFNRNKQFVH